MNGHLLHAGQLKVDLAQRDAPSRFLKIQADWPLNTVVFGHTAGLLGPSEGQRHWEPDVADEHRRRGGTTKHVTPFWELDAPVELAVVPRDAAALHSTLDSLVGCLQRLISRTPRIILEVPTTKPSAMTHDEEEHILTISGGIRLRQRIRRDFFRQLEWRWVTTEDSTNPIRWAECRRWHYAEEVHERLTCANWTVITDPGTTGQSPLFELRR